ncbi:ABC transporter permease [Actinomadura syzygii]|nr:ABC transporter permease [Actinomadura syzygii]
MASNVQSVDDASSVSAAEAGPPRSRRAADAAAAKRRSRNRKLKKMIWPLVSTLSVVVFLGAWQIAASTEAVNPLFTSSPSRAVEAFRDLVDRGELWPNLWISAQEFLIGFGLAVVVGIPLGILIGWYRPVEAVFSPFVTFMNSIPRIALLPLLIIWIGIGVPLKITIVFLGAVIAILINTIAGMKALDQQLLTMARSFKASDFQIFRTIALPGSVPFILSGLRFGLGHSLVGVVVGEMFASNQGIGHIIAVAGNTFQTDLVFVGVVIIASFGLLFTWLLARLEQRFESWRKP